MEREEKERGKRALQENGRQGKRALEEKGSKEKGKKGF